MKTQTLKATAVAASLLAASIAHAQTQPKEPPPQTPPQAPTPTSAQPLSQIQVQSSTPSVAPPTVLDPGKFKIEWYGLADVALVYASSGNGGKWRVDGGGGMQASRLGIRASRDFEDGIRAYTILEAGVQFDTGGAGSSTPVLGINDTNASSGGANGTGSRLFARQALAGVSGKYGSLSLGRQYTGSYAAIAGVGSAWGDGLYANPGNFLPLLGGMPTRVDNALVYSTPNFSGLSGILTVTTGAENNVRGTVPAGTTTSTTDKAGQGFDLLARFDHGPLTLAASTWQINNNSYVTSGETGLAKKRGFQVAGNYNFGWMLLTGAYVKGKISGGNYENVTKTLSDATGWDISARFPFGEANRHNLFVAYSSVDDKSLQNRDGKLFGFAYWYQLEMNTRIYLSYGELKNNANAVYALPDSGNIVGNVTVPGTKPRGAAIGLNYAF